MTGYIARRLLLMIPVLWGVSLIVFTAIRLVPGDVLMAKMQGEFTTKPEQLAQMRAELGLDVPGYVQYARWIGGVLHGDFGTSMNTFRPVLGEIINRVNFGGKPVEPPALDENGKPVGGPANRRAEMWLNLKTALQGRFSIPGGGRHFVRTCSGCGSAR